jgi:hypothetical protein
MKSKPSVVLLVRRGVHRGARITLTEGHYIIGARDDCDFVLSDPGIPDRLLELHVDQLDARVLAFVDDIVVNGLAIAVGPVVELRSFKSRISIGSLELQIIDGRFERPAVAETRTERKGKPDSNEYMRRLSLIAAAVAVVFVTFGGYTVLPRTSGTALSLVASGEATMPGSMAMTDPEIDLAIQVGGLLASNEAWRHIKLKKRPSDQRYELTGTVKDRHALEALLSNAVIKRLGTNASAIVVAADLEQRLADFTRDTSLKTSVGEDGRVVVTGAVSSNESNKRLNTLRHELEGKVDVDFRVAQQPRVVKQVQVALPIKIASINGDQRFFESSDGEKYFEGSILSNGIRVVAISTSRIRFNIAGKNVDFQV